MNILVTGGAGFIGSHLVRRLLREGHDVCVIDNLSTGKKKNLAEVFSQIKFIEGDLRDERATRDAVQGREIVFHEAALPSVPRSVKDPKTSVDNNVMGTVELLKQSVDAGVRRFIYAGSSSAYGNCASATKAETLVPRVLSPYAASKLAGEGLVQSFGHCYGLETVVTRYFNVFGERQDASSQYSGVIAKFCCLMLAGQTPTIFGDGNHARDFTYIENVVEGNMRVAMSDARSVAGEVFNIACGGSVSLNELVDGINQVLGTAILPTYAAPRTGDIKHSQADIDKARAAVGYIPVVGFLEGLSRTMAWYRQQMAEQGLLLNSA